MRLIIGGAYQGKKKYAYEKYGDQNIITNFHLVVLEMLKNDIDPILYIKQNLSDYADKIIICDDISCGVVPVDPLTRKWREILGHVLAFLAKESDDVVRVFCGIGTKIK